MRLIFAKSWSLGFILFITSIRWYKLLSKQRKNRKYYRKCSNNFAVDCNFNAFADHNGNWFKNLHLLRFKNLLSYFLSTCVTLNDSLLFWILLNKTDLLFLKILPRYSRQQNHSSICNSTCDFSWFDCQFLSSHACYKQYEA